MFLIFKLVLIYLFLSLGETNIECRIHVSDNKIVQNIVFKTILDEFVDQLVIMGVILLFAYSSKIFLSLLITLFVFIYNSIVIWNSSEEENLRTKLLRIGTRLINNSPFFLLYDY